MKVHHSFTARYLIFWKTSQGISLQSISVKKAHVWPGRLTAQNRPRRSRSTGSIGDCGVSHPTFPHSGWNCGLKESPKAALENYGFEGHGLIPWCQLVQFHGKFHSILWFTSTLLSTMWNEDTLSNFRLFFSRKASKLLDCKVKV